MGDDGDAEIPAAVAAALARKYRALIDLRRTRDGDGGAGDAGGAPALALRPHLRALAREFPGCLRELDTLGVAELDRRAAATTRAAAGGAREPWMAWIAGYHALMRAALHIKGAATEAADQGALAQQAAALSGTPVAITFVEAALRPPQGRLGVVVLRALSVRFGVPAAEIAAALFPPRRPRPYQL